MQSDLDLQTSFYSTAGGVNYVRVQWGDSFRLGEDNLYMLDYRSAVVSAWLKDRCQGPWRVGQFAVEFREPDDAIMFYLRFK